MIDDYMYMRAYSDSAMGIFSSSILLDVQNEEEGSDQLKLDSFIDGSPWQYGL